MRLFRKRKSPNRVQQVTSNMMKDAMLFVQHRWVRLMQRWESRYSVRQKKRVFILCAVAGCVYCSFVLVNAFRQKETVSSEIPVTPPMQGPVLHLPTPKLSSQDSLAIVRFKKMLDSLATTDSGQAMLNELQRMRPGLVDSVYNMEKLIY